MGSGTRRHWGSTEEDPATSKWGGSSPQEVTSKLGLRKKQFARGLDFREEGKQVGKRGATFRDVGCSLWL